MCERELLPRCYIYELLIVTFVSDIERFEFLIVIP